MDIRQSIGFAIASATGVVAVIVGPGVARAESWKSLTPLRSTCEDVKRVMGTSDCSSRQEFEFRDEKVTIFLEDSLPCDELWPTKHWDVPEGTVPAIHVRPKTRRMISEYGIPFDE